MSYICTEIKYLVTEYKKMLSKVHYVINFKYLSGWKKYRKVFRGKSARTVAAATSASKTAHDSGTE